jgi:hypothetical protein
MLPKALGGHAVREHFQAIIIAGLIAGVMGGAWMWINRYEIKPHDSESFRLRDRLTGQVELCAAAGKFRKGKPSFLKEQNISPTGPQDCRRETRPRSRRTAVGVRDAIQHYSQSSETRRRF